MAESAAEKGILKALTGTREFQELQNAAKLTTKVLDGSLVEEVLTKVQTYINQHLHIEQDRKRHQSGELR